MITITNQTTNVQAEFQTESLKLVGNATIEQNGVVAGVSGSIYKRSRIRSCTLALLVFRKMFRLISITGKMHRC